MRQIQTNHGDRRLIAAMVLLACIAAHGQTYEQLYAFRAGLDGYGPKGGLVEGADANFYGTTYYGGQPTTNCGACGYGTAFKIPPDGNLATIAWFDGTNNGGYPFGTMVLGSDGNLYGATEAQGFKLEANGILTAGPAGSDIGDLIQATDGYLYGAGAYYGIVFWFSLDGQSHGFVYTPGSPSGGLIQASDGNLYGLTYNGGTYNLGTAYKLTTNCVLTTLVSFGPISNPPVRPYGKLLQASDGNLYGVTDYTVFRITLGGALTNLAWFGIGDAKGHRPNGGLIEANDGNFYGTTFEGGSIAGAQGTVFKMTPQGRISTLFVFSYRGAYPGSGPLAGLIQGSDGNLYGTCAYGGTYGGGNVFRIIMPGPQVALTNMDGNAILSWRTNYTGFNLQISTDLEAGMWTDLTNEPAVASGRFWVTNTPSGTPQFFRLGK